MKKLLIAYLFILSLGTDGFTQKASEARKLKLEQEKLDQLFDPSDTDFKVKEVPEEFKNESAVILSQKKEYSFYTEKNMLYAKEIVRRRIKLLDKTSLEDFSTLYFYKESGTGYDAKDINVGIGIVIEKINGTRVQVDTKEAIKMEGSLDVPSYYRSLLNYSWNYYKLAIPDLEVGDIIDYVTEGKKSNYNSGGYAYPSMIVTLNEIYPVVKQKYIFNTERGFFLNCNTFNGAPALQKTETVDRKQYIYTLVDVNRPRIKGTYWFYKYRVLPTLKFQVFNAQIGKSTEYFIGDKDEPKKSIAEEEIATKVNERIIQTDNITDIIVGEIKSNISKKLEPMEYLRRSYYYFRHTVMEKKMIGFTPVSSINDEYFCRTMAAIMQEKGIKYDVIITAAKEVSALSDVVSSDEFIWMIRTGDTYISNFMYGSNFGDLNYHTLGVEAIAITPNKNGKLVKPVRFILPHSNPADNVANITIDAVIDENLEHLKVQRKNNITGYFKEAFAEEGLVFTDYNTNDYKLFGGEAPKDETLETRNKTKIAEIERKRKELVDERVKNKKEYMKSILEREYSNFISFDDFSLIADGRSHNSSVLEYNEGFQIGDLIQKVGKNYMFQAGALIGKQTSVDQDDRDRNFDIFMTYPRTILYNLSVNIPEGYSLEGIEALKFKVENNAVTFSSVPEVKDGKLIVKIQKVYKNDYFKKEEWSNIVASLDAGFDFTQKKVMFKKK